MPGFASLDEVINAVSAQARGQVLQVQKRSAVNTVASVAAIVWQWTGIPVAGATPSTGLGSAVACTSATSGAMPFTNPSGGRTMHGLSISLAATTGGGGTALLVDRLAHANITNNQATGNFSPVLDGTPRLATGEGAMLMLEVTATLGSGNNTRNFTYTNQAGTSGRVTGNVTTASAAGLGRVPYGTEHVFVPLQAGDTGVRSVETATLVSGTQTGNINVVLVNPIAPPITLTSAALLTDRDLVVEIPSLPRIRDDACLSWIFVSASSAAYSLMGEVRIAEN